MAQQILTKDFVCLKEIGGKGEMVSCGYKRKATGIYLHPDKIILDNVSCKADPSKKDFVCDLKSIKKYKLGDKYSDAFDYCGMLKQGTQATLSLGKQKLTKLAESYEDVNYHSEASPLFDAIEALKKSNKRKAELKIKEFNIESSKTLLRTC